MSGREESAFLVAAFTGAISMLIVVASGIYPAKKWRIMFAASVVIAVGIAVFVQVLHGGAS